MILGRFYKGVLIMGIRQDYLKNAVDIIMKANPSYERDRVEEIVSRKMKEKMTNPTVVMENDIKKRYETITLTKLCDWIEREKPVVSGNATFYVQPEVLQSPTVVMLRDLKKARSRIKKEMFNALSQGDEDTYKRLDLAQANAKVIMNAEYGASGAPSAAFYNKYTPSATTLMAQSIITIMAAFFEGYVGNNQKFFHINELFDWITIVLEKDVKLKDIKEISIEDTILRLKNTFITYDRANDSIIESFVQNCNARERSLLYYANNIYEFIRRNDVPKMLLKGILTKLPILEASTTIPSQYVTKFTKLDDYNNWVSKEMFMNPYDPPEIISKDMEDLSSLINDFCFIEYLTPDSIVKLNNQVRTAVLLVDTDSNVINANIFVEFVLDELFPNESFNRKRVYNDIICANILTRLQESCIKRILDLYGRRHNMGEDSRKELVMKNEFMFRRLLLMEEKKRYASSIVLREGNILMPFKTDIKGLDFIKAGVTDEVTETFTKMIENHILFSETLELQELLQDLKKFEKEIYHDLSHGGTRFLKPQSYKPEEAYKRNSDGRTTAWQLPVFRSVAVWNELFPQKRINSLDRVKILKLVITKQDDLLPLKNKFPEEYDLLLTKIFQSPNPELVKAGLKVIAIPSNVKEIPVWLLDFIDYDNILSDVLGSFRSVIRALKIESLDVKTPNGVARLVSGLISI